ncbi:DUF1513 domain-containing protein [Pseudomonas sp. P155]|uniref:DUF1513 domain-containing protein n=1 Tax=Pseudomonas neuropathica TaxID=2730425 RepID=A0ABS0BHY0_9PSED|nr:DUF1513 domain-containing protein [Pseudomonas neuropathica]
MRVGRDGFLHVTVFMQKRGHAIMASRRQTRAVAFGRRPRFFAQSLWERACSRMQTIRSI